MLTALEKIADNCKVSLDNSKRYEKVPLDRSYSKGYLDGESAAYNDSHKIMKKELERLRNLWQNGQLSYDSFGV